jgi:carbonic anhydrase/acetyltransferase-like protein (isoleucine patch superfamily)
MVLELDNIKPKIHESTFIANSADIIGNVEIFENVSIWFGAVLRGDVEKIVVGKNSNIQDNSTVHTDFGIPCIIGENVTIGHNVVLHSCNISDNVIVGMGSTILNGAKIAKNCLVGANSLVTHKLEYEEGMLILGNPAKIVRMLTDEEIEHIIKNANHYVENAKRYK